MGRFIQPDPLVPEPGNPQAYNRYAYVYNNPLKYTDPTGHMGDPDRDYGGKGKYSFGNVTSHPAYKRARFATNKRFLWATRFHYREHLWLETHGLSREAGKMLVYHKCEARCAISSLTGTCDTLGSPALPLICILWQEGLSQRVTLYGR